TGLAWLGHDMVAAIEALPDGEAGRMEVAYLLPGASDEETPFQSVSAPGVFRLELDFEQTMAALEAEAARLATDAAAVGRERALVIGVSADDERFAETVELVRAADVAVAGMVRPKRKQIPPCPVVGPGTPEDTVLAG